MFKGVIPVALFCAVTATAQVNWTGALDTNWLNGGNWNPGGPASGDDVQIDVLNSTVSLGGNGFARSLTLGANQTGVLFNINSVGNLTMSDAALTLSNASILNVNNGGTLNLTYSSAGPYVEAGSSLNVNSGGIFRLNTGSSLQLLGNGGNINVTAGANDALWQIYGSGGLGISGFTPGNIILRSTGAGVARITGLSGAEDVTLYSGQTLTGFGEITNMGFHVSGDSTGAGVVNANVLGETLHLAAGPTSRISIDNFGSDGVFKATNGATLRVDFSDAGFVNNGTLRADEGSTTIVAGNVAHFENYNGGSQSLNGGTFSTAGTMQLAINNIVTNNSNIVLEGAGVLQDLLGNDVLSNSLRTNNGSLSVQLGSTLALNNGSFTNHGTVQVGGDNSTLDLRLVDLSNHVAQTPFGDTTFQLGSWTISGINSDLPTRVVYSSPFGPITQIGQLTAIGYPGVDAADRTFLTLEGGSSLLTDDGTQDALRTLTAINSNGTLTLRGHDFTTAGDFSVAGALVLDNTNFTIAGNFRNLDTGALVGGTLDLGGTSVLQHNGSFIDTLGDGTTATSLTLRGPDAFLTFDGSTDSLENLSLIKANASLTLVDRDFFTFGNFQNDGTLTIQGTGCNCPLLGILGDLTNNGVLNIIGDGSNPFTGAGAIVVGNLTNVHADGTLVGGTIHISGDSILAYNGAPIVQIGDGVTPTAIIMNGPDAFLSNDFGSSDALGSLAAIAKAGSLSLTDYDMVTPGDFTNNGALSLNRSFFDINGGSGNLTNVNGAGVLQGGSYNIRDSELTYTGAAIQQIGSGNPGDAATSITLAGTGGISNNGIGPLDGLQLAKIASNGSLTLADWGSLQTPGDFTNDGALSLHNTNFLVGPGGTNTITNIDGAGVMTGGSYSLSGSSTLSYTGSGITQLGDNLNHSPTSITLDGPGAFFTNDGFSDALAPLSRISENSSLTLIDRGLFAAQGDFTNNGSLTLRNTSLLVQPDFALTNFSGGTLAGGSYTLLGNSNLQFSGTAIVNFGDGVATTTGVLDGASKFTPNGANDLLTGLAHVADHASLTLQNGYSLALDNSLTVDGTMTVTGASTVNVDSGLLTVNGSLGVRDHSLMTANGLDVGPGGSIRVGEASVLDAHAGNFMALDGAGTLLRGTYEIDGTLDRTGSSFEYSGIHIGGAADGSHPGIQTIGANATVILNGFGSLTPFVDDNASNTDAFSQLHQVDGTLVLQNAAQHNFSNPNLSGFTPYNMLNDGHITLEGSVQFPGGGGYPTLLSVNGLFTNGSGAELIVRTGGIFNSTAFGDPMYQPGFSNAGKLVVEGGSASLGQWTDLSGGVLGGGGTYDLAGFVSYRGGSSEDLISEIGGNVDMTLRGGYALKNEYQNPDWNNPTYANALGSLQTIDAGATLTLTDGADLSDSTDLTSNGTLNVLNGATLAAPTLTNTGRLLLSAGSSIVANTFIQSGGAADTEADGTIFANVDLTGGILHGTGLITGNVVQEGGTLHPGNSPGTLSIDGTYLLGPGGFLAIDFDSSDPLGVPGFDWSFLTTTGSAQLDGIVRVNLLRSLTFHLGDVFQIGLFGSIVPNPLLTVQFLALGGGMHFDALFNGNELDLRVAADQAAAPEPTTIVLLGAGLAGLIAFGRRRARK